jgi:hypothetical protein
MYQQKDINDTENADPVFSYAHITRAKLVIELPS